MKINKKFEQYLDEETFQNILPWYINGTISEVERINVQFMIENHDWARKIWQQELLMIGDLACLKPTAAHDFGLSDLLGRVRKEKSFKNVVINFFHQKIKFLAGGSYANIRNSFAMASVLIMVTQSLLLVFMSSRDSGDVGEFGAPRSIVSYSKGGVVRIIVDSSVSEADFRNTLRSVNADIVSGPSQFGEYWVKSSVLSQMEMVRALEKTSRFSLVSPD